MFRAESEKVFSYYFVKMTVCQDNTIRFDFPLEIGFFHFQVHRGKTELYEVNENMSKIVENNLHTSKVEDKEFYVPVMFARFLTLNLIMNVSLQKKKEMSQFGWKQFF